MTSTTAAAEPQTPHSFESSPEKYRHWRLTIDGCIATVALDVDENAALIPGQPLKLNSYDLGVDIELADCVQRLRFEHPEVRAVILTSARPDVFCAGANIQMLRDADHGFKQNFCRFTNETRLAIEDAGDQSGQRWLCALNGTASGGGYELALACDHILLVDDGNAAVSLPEVALLGVLPGTGGLVRLVDKRRVRRDRADVLCTTAEGMRGGRALEWGLVDELAPRSGFDEAALSRALLLAESSDRPSDAQGVTLTPLRPELQADRWIYDHVTVALIPDRRTAEITVNGPLAEPPADPAGIAAQGADFWPLAMARELDDTILRLRFGQPDLGTLILRTHGDGKLVARYDSLLLNTRDHWLVREVLLLLARTLRRVDVTARSLVALVEPGSCFAGTLTELVLGADRSYMLEGVFDETQEPAVLRLGPMNLGPLPMANGRARLLSHFSGRDEDAARAAASIDEPCLAAEALALGLVTAAPDDIDWEDEVRLAIEERAGFSPDALTGMEASLRFAGPETMETKIFGRLTAWQNWVFQRPNAAGPDGALHGYGTGARPRFDRRRT